jgi:pilus assembly protein Flp/PilA
VCVVRAEFGTLALITIVASTKSFTTTQNREEYLMLTPFVARFTSFLKNEDGPTAVEYAVMLALIIVVCIAAISTLGSNASNTFSYVGTKVDTTSS